MMPNGGFKQVGFSFLRIMKTFTFLHTILKVYLDCYLVYHMVTKLRFEAIISIVSSVLSP